MSLSSPPARRARPSTSAVSFRTARPSAWAVSFLMFSIVAAVAAFGLLGADFGLI